MNRVLRPLLKADFPAIIEIENRTFTPPWPPDAFTDFLLGESWVLELDDVLIGYLMCHAAVDEAMIINFAIDPKFQGQKHGGFMLINVIELLREEGFTRIFLDVRKSNAAAIALYEKHGFRELGIRKGYYSDPEEDALVMGRYSK